MTFKDIPKVTADKNGGYKYILIEVTDTEQQSKYILFADKTASYHSGLFNSFKLKYGDSFTYTCNGGGYIKINPKDTTIVLHGKSTAYGEANLDIVHTILKEEYPNYSIIT